jgi:hypothetical protein
MVTRSDDDDDDYHQKVRSKLKRSLIFTQDEALVRFEVLASVAAEPIDHLLMRLQKESEAGNFLLAILTDATNPFVDCMRLYTKMFTEAPGDSMLRIVFHHFAHCTASCVELIMLARQLILQMASEVWLKCVHYFDRYPFKLAALVDVRSEPTCVQQAAAEFLMTPECCMDAGFSRKAPSSVLYNASMGFYRAGVF